VPIDASLLTAVVQHRTPWLDDVMVFFSVIGNRGVLWLVLGAAGLLFTDRKPQAWRLVLTMLCTYLVVDVALKAAFGRPRPYELLAGLQILIDRPTSSSFPSTHAALGIAGALAGARVFPSAAWILWPLGILVGVSRLYVGVHWPSDVAGGMLAGAAVAWFVTGGRATPRRRLP
jgi:undecaprenyl-diphosphatase